MLAKLSKNTRSSARSTALKTLATPDAEERLPTTGGDTTHAALFRKADCACGGSCPACGGKHAGLTISQPTDPAETEADQTADRVMQTSTVEEDHPPLERKVTSTTRSGSLPTDPGRLYDALSSGGEPLDKQTRDFFEPRFGFDLGDVRVHRGPAAENSAKEIDAMAYTVGNNVVFASGAYQPESESGLSLLAHELAHVTRSADTKTVHRRPAARPPTRTQNRPVYSGSRQDQENLNRLGGGNPNAPRHADQGKDTDWGAAVDANMRRDAARATMRDHEVPIPVTHPGGSPPDFIKLGSPTEAETRTGRIRYTPRFFHILDAMEHDVMLSTSIEEDMGLLLRYFPERWRPGLQHDFGTGLPGSVTLDNGTVVRPRLPAGAAIGKVRFQYDENSVPDRFRAFQAALAKRARLKKQRELEATLAEAEQFALKDLGGARVSGACDYKLTPRKGGNKKHDNYAKHVAKEKGFGNRVNKEIEWTTPEGASYSFDTYNPKDKTQVFEVKTRHEWASPERIGNAPAYIPNLSERIIALEGQRLRGLFVAARCGLSFRYAFDACAAYRGFKQQWNMPPLEYIPYPGEPTEICND